MRLLPLSLLLAASTLLFSCRTTVRVERQIELSVPLPAAGPVGLDIETRNGSVTVEVDTSVTQLEITASCRASGSNLAMAEQRIASFDVFVRVLPDGVHEVRPEISGGWRNGDGVSLRVVVPHAGATVIHTSNGRVSVGEVNGDCRLSTSNGNVVTGGTYGDLEIDTSNGSVKVLDHFGPLEATSSNGSMTVVLADESNSPFRVATSNGSVRVEVGSAWEGRFEGSTSNGSLRHKEHGEVVAKRKGSIAVQRGARDEVSTASSSNGSITIEVR